MQKPLFLACSRMLFFSFFVLTQQAPVVAQDKQSERSISDPCQQAKPIVEKVNGFVAAAVFSSALCSTKDSAQTDPAHEHIVAFGRDTEENIIASAMGAGGKSNSVVPRVPNAFADLHTHPNGTPPSSGDLYGLLRQHQKNNRYNMRFVLLPEGTLYAFVVVDAAAAAAFYERFPPQQAPGYSPLFPDSLLNEYREIIGRYGAKEELAMAYLLQKYKAGVALLKQEDEAGFRVLRAVVHQTGNKLVFVSGNCAY